MKKFLLATTAAVATLYSGVALADVKVQTGGYYEFTAGIFDIDDVDGLTNRDFQSEAEVFVKAMGVADNGLQYSAEIQFRNGSDDGEGGSNTLAVDEAFLTLAGSWGSVMLGDTDGAADMLAVYAPVVEGYGQIDTDRDGGANYKDYLGMGPVSVHVVDTDDATKVTYMTPNFSGFQAGVSYVPEEFDEGQNVVDFETSDYADLFEVAANYTHDFGAWGVKLGLGLTTGDSEDGTLEDFTAWSVGAQVSWGGFTVGGAWVDNDEFGHLAGVDTEENDGWNLGVTYETGPLAVGASWLSAEGDFVEDYDAYGVGMVYTVAPGLVVQSDLMLANEEFTGGTDSDGWVWMLGTRMTF